MKRIFKVKTIEELLTDAQMLRDEAYAEMTSQTPDIKRVVDLRLQANKLSIKAERRDVIKTTFLLAGIGAGVGTAITVIGKTVVKLIKK